MLGRPAVVAVLLDWPVKIEAVEVDPGEGHAVVVRHPTGGHDAASSAPAGR